MATSTSCSHLEQVREVEPSTRSGCEDSLRIGGRWVHLRMCLTCGHVGCCDSSPNRHATRHFASTGHPLIRSFQPGEEWAWCYVDQLPMPLEIIAKQLLAHRPTERPLL